MFFCKISQLALRDLLNDFLSKVQKRLGFRISAIFCFRTMGLVSTSRSRETFNLRYIISLKINLSPQGLEFIIKVIRFAERFSSHLRCHAFLNVRSSTALHLSQTPKLCPALREKSYVEEAIEQIYEWHSSYHIAMTEYHIKRSHVLTKFKWDVVK